MNNVKSLEEQITDREAEWLRGELDRAAKIVQDAFKKYTGPNFESASIRKPIEDEWNSALRAQFYFGWSSMNACVQFTVPTSMRPILAEYAAKQLLERIAAVEELAGEAMGIAEFAHRQ
jgi:hypothetical protein